MVDIQKIAKALSPAQRYHVERGCISGDFTMETVKALKRRGLFELVINSSNGRYGFMELTPLGKQVRQAISAPSDKEGGA